MSSRKTDPDTKDATPQSQEKIKYIVNKSRKIVVINGHPYYQSTGQNSGLPGVWLPFLGVKGSISFDISLSAENFNRLGVIALHGEKKGWFIKKTVIGVNCPESAESAWCVFSLTQKINNNKPSGKKMDKIFDRLYLKSDLIVSLRLTDPYAWGLRNRATGEPDLKRIYDGAELSVEEIAFSKIPLKLDDKPEMQENDPDKTNDWLMQQGATYLKDIIFEAPTSYKKMWDKAAGPFYQSIESLRKSELRSDRQLAETLENDTQLSQTKAILMDYIVTYSRTKRFLLGHWNRHHIKKVYEALQNSELDSAIMLATYVRFVVGDDLKPNGSLAKRLNFIDEQIISNKRKAKMAYLATLEWEKKKDASENSPTNTLKDSKK